MASSYSTNLALEIIATGEQAGTWGATTNINLGTLLEQAISGYLIKGVTTGTDTTITIPNGATGEARNMTIELTGSGGASTNLIVPSNKKLYFIYNNTSSGQVTVKVSGLTGVSVPNGKKMVLVSNGTDIVEAVNYMSTNPLSLFSYTTTATAAGTTTLTSASNYLQYFTGVTTQTVVMPVTSTLSLGWNYQIINNSTGNLTVNSSGGNLIVTVLPATAVTITVILTSGTTAASWNAEFTGFSSVTGTGANVLGTSPTITFSGTGTTFSGSTSGTTVLKASAIAGTTTATLPATTATLGYLNIPAVGTKTASYTLALADVGKYVQLGTSGAIIIPDATFTEGDAITLFNNTSGNITITCTITTAYISGTNTDKATMTLATRGLATIFFVSGTVCVVSGSVS
jgi:hypothetical protein